MNELTREGIIDAASRAAEKVGPSISRSEFERISGIGQYHIYRLFPDGGWTEVKRLAGLVRHPKDNASFSDEELIEEFHRVTSLLGKIPTWAIFSHHADMSADVIRRRFGGLKGTLARYRDWLKKYEANSPVLEQLQTKYLNEIPVPPNSLETLSQKPKLGWKKIAGPVYGAPINFVVSGMPPLMSKELSSYLAWSPMIWVSLLKQFMMHFQIVRGKGASIQRTNGGKESG